MVENFNMIYDLVCVIQYEVWLKGDIGSDDDNRWWAAFFQDG